MTTNTSDPTKVLLSVRGLKKYFKIGGGMIFDRQGRTLKAVDDVTFDVFEGETFGLVGESGCGKTTLGQSIVRLYEPTDGQIILNGQDIAKLGDEALRPLRRNMQMIFQDPASSLDPRMTVGDIIGEPLDVFRVGTKSEQKQRVQDLLKVVGLNPFFVNRYPHEFSGGQRQRIGIARALALNPRLIICDEAVSALDVSVQAQVLNLLRDLQAQFGLTYIFVAHNLAVVAHISDRIGVMYLGRLVEMGTTSEIYDTPKHPYTQALLTAIPVPTVGAKKRQRIILQGDVPSPLNPPSGCPFHPRCPIANLPRCATEIPVFEEKSKGHWAACHYTN
ncbi:MAG: ATP-binding cassette domain-containing protein [Chloroflexi bacterium]|nr:ATP-binding cassette domain-containing protein [Chloroflexota bacterium]